MEALKKRISSLIEHSLELDKATAQDYARGLMSWHEFKGMMSEQEHYRRACLDVLREMPVTEREG